MTVASSTTPPIDLIFPALGKSVPLQHGYALFGALSRVVPWLHTPEAKSANVGVFGIGGMRVGGAPAASTQPGDAALLLNDRSALRIRTPADRLPLFLPLAGQTLELDGHRFRLGVPRVAALVPATAVGSPLVLIKISSARDGVKVTPDLFLDSARRLLADRLGITAAEVGLPVYRQGPLKDQPKKRVIRVKDQTHVGFAMVVQGLTADESLRLQEQGLGGRRLMGCGCFLPERGA